MLCRAGASTMRVGEYVCCQSANLCTAYGFYLLSCDPHSAILWTTKRERERAQREPHNSHTNLVLSEQAEVRQPKFNTLAKKNGTFEESAMSERHILTSCGALGLLLNHHVYLALQHRAPVSPDACPGRVKCGAV